MKAKRSFCLSKHFHYSKDEAGYCNWLLARKQGGEIKDYKVFPSVPLMIAGKPWKRWQIDFMVDENDGTVSYHEAHKWGRGQAVKDDYHKLKRDAFLLCYPRIKLYINKELYTGKPNRKRLKWTMAEAKRRSERARKMRKK